MPPVMAGQPPYGSPDRARRRRRRGIALGPGIILGCVGVVGALMLAGMLALFLVYNHYSNRLEGEIDRLEELTNYQSFETTVIYDDEGTELYQVIGEGRRTRISLDQIPENMIEATIAIEDDTFYENRGIDLPSIARAAWQYVRYGYIVSGGSTITLEASTTLFTSALVTSLSALVMAITPRLLSEEMCSPVTPTTTERIWMFPACRCPLSTALLMASVVASRSTTTPLRSPSEGASPTPTISAAPVSRSAAANTQHALVVPMSRPAIYSFRFKA